MKQITALLILFCGSHVLLSAQRQLVYSDKNYSFRLVMDSVAENNWGKPDSTVKSITVTRLKDHKVIQTITPSENFVCRDNKREMIFEDVNFDGYNDFALFEFEAKRAQTAYLYYLFDPKKGRFFLSKEIAEVLSSAALDKKNKTLSKLYRVSGGDYKLVVYRFIQNKLTLIEEREDKSIGDAGYHILHKKRINGQMKIIRDQVLNKKQYENSNDGLMPFQ